MTFVAKCPGCGREYHVRDDQIDRKAHCPCGQYFTLRMHLDETQLHQARVAPSLKKPDALLTEAAVPADNPPRQIGPYRLRQPIGRGGMGEVWLAYDVNLHRDLAVKLLPEALSNDEEGLRRFLREARLAARLVHANVVTVYDAGVENHRAYLVMQYIPGGTLAEAANHPLPWREAVRTIRDAAKGLHAAHELGMVHRDVKPANLMRGVDGSIKVVDFGLARMQWEDSKLSAEGVVLGTGAYMAPEQWIGQEADRRSDIYSLTCTLYHLLAGRVPFAATALPALGYCHRHEPFPDPRQFAARIPDALCRILARGSAKDAGCRYQSCAELLDEVNALLATDDMELACDLPWESFVLALTMPFARAESEPEPAAPAQAEPMERPLGPMKLRHRFSRQWSSLWLDPMTPQLWVTGGLVALFVAAALIVVSYQATGHGTVNIHLSEPGALVNVSVDGNPVPTSSIAEPLKLMPGSHHLKVVGGARYADISRPFVVRRGSTEDLNVTLSPRNAASSVEVQH